MFPSAVRLSQSLYSRGPRETVEDIFFHLCCTSRLSNPSSIALYDRCSQPYFKWRFSNRVPTEAPLNPIKIVPVDPDQITEFSRRRFPNSDNMRRDMGTIKAGDWDIRDTVPTDRFGHRREYFDNFGQFDDSLFYQSLEQHFNDDVPWLETKYIQTFLKYEDMTQRETLLKYRSVDDLYHRIKTDGYNRQREIHPNRCWVQRFTDEVSIDIGRDGELLFVDGKHRLATAKILDLDWVPVGIIVRHKDWLERRDERARSASEPAHPDLVECTNGEYWMP